MPFALYIQPKARKALDKIPQGHRAKIVSALDDIVRDPFAFKQLSGTLKGHYSARVWPYRIIFRVEKRLLVILVVDIGHRQGVYE